MNFITGQRRAAITRGVRRLPRLAVAGAWFFIVFSLGSLAWVVGTKWSDPAGLTTLYQTSVETITGEETYRAWGLAYSGTWGLILALVQALVVGTAAVVSTRPASAWYRKAHGVLIAWSALWMIDLMYLTARDGAVDSYVQATMLTILFGCTVFRAVRPPRARSSEPVDVEAEAFPPLDETPIDETPHEPAEMAPAPEDLGRFARWTAALTARMPAGARDRLDRMFSWMGNAASRTGRTARDVGVKAAPVARAGAERTRSLGRRFVALLRSKGVIPHRTAG
jgi:hypothetical protein